MGAVLNREMRTVLNRAATHQRQGRHWVEAVGGEFPRKLLAYQLADAL